MTPTASSALPRRTERAPRAACAALAALAVLGCATARTTAPSAPAGFTPPPRTEPVRLVLTAAAGEPFDLSDHRGRAVLVVAFTLHDLPSQAMIRTLERVARRHPDDLAVVAVAGDREAPATLRVLLDAYRDVERLERVILATASDEVRAGASPLGEIAHVPTLFFLNRAGVIVRRIDRTLLSEPQVEALIAPALPAGE